MALLFAILLLGVGQPATAQEVSDTPGADPGQTIPPLPEGTPMYIPLAAAGAAPVPTPTPRIFEKVPVEGGSLGWPAQSSPDVNLSLRGYSPITASLALINKDGPSDDQAPQLAGIFSPARLPVFTATYQVYDWDWSCNAPVGCRGNPLTSPHEVTLLQMAAAPGEPLSIASRSRRIYPGDFKAMVLYAEEGRLTLTYTRDDSPANGYVVHFEDVAVAPELVALYRQLDAAGRKELPALRNGEVWGTAGNAILKVAVRDRGTFMDPRACKDWWVDYRGQCILLLSQPLPAAHQP
jgi:hypothetical protein